MLIVTATSETESCQFWQPQLHQLDNTEFMQQRNTEAEAAAVLAFRLKTLSLLLKDCWRALSSVQYAITSYLSVDCCNSWNPACQELQTIRAPKWIQKRSLSRFAMQICRAGYSNWNQLICTHSPEEVRRSWPLWRKLPGVITNWLSYLNRQAFLALTKKGPAFQIKF